MKTIKERTSEINAKILSYKNKRNKNLKIILSSFICFVLVISAILVPIIINNDGKNSSSLHPTLNASLYNIYSEKKELFNEINSANVNTINVKNNNTISHKNLIANEASESNGLLSYYNQTDTQSLIEQLKFPELTGINSCVTININNLTIIGAMELSKDLSYAKINEMFNYFSNYYSNYLFQKDNFNMNITFKMFNNIIFVNVMSIYDIFIDVVTKTDIGYISQTTKTFIKLTSKNDTIIIPEGIETIANDAFRNQVSYTSLAYNDFTKKIVLPQTLKKVGDYAFYNCVALEEINLPNTLEYIGSYAFSIEPSIANFPSKLEITHLPTNLTYIGSNAFNNLTNYRQLSNNSIYIIDNWVVGFKGVQDSVTIPNNVVGIAERSFVDANVSKLFIPESVNYINKNIVPNITGKYIGIFIENIDAFKDTWDSNCFRMLFGSLSSKIMIYYNYTNQDVLDFDSKASNIGSTIHNYEYRAFDAELKEPIYIDENVEFIEPYAFYFTNTNQFIVDEDNPYFCSIDGVIYTKDLKKLVAFPNKKEVDTFTVPSSVEVICDFAFNNCLKINNIYVPKTVKYIGAGAFYFLVNSQNVIFEQGIYSLDWDSSWYISSKVNLIWNY